MSRRDQEQSNRARSSQRPPRGEKELQLKDGERLILGRNPVREILKHKRRQVKKIICRSGLIAADPNSEFRPLKSDKFTLQEVSLDALEHIADGVRHQGIGAIVEAMPTLAIADLIRKLEDKDRYLIVALDGIEDPHNFGTILRACECFGVSGVIFTRNRGCHITPAVVKTSAGASELVPLVEVGNLVSALERLKESGAWVVAADVGPDSVEVSSVDLPKKLILVLGAEGIGVKNLVRERSDFVVKISMCGVIDSLNVSQASAVFLHELSKRIF